MKEQTRMWSYVLYFLIGGTIVSAVAYVGTHADGKTAAFVAGLPVLFVINLLLLYQNGGISAGMSYARGALMYVPIFVACVGLTLFLLPRLPMPLALVAGLSLYAVPVIARSVRRADNSRPLTSELVPAVPLPATHDSVSSHEDSAS
jgi:hypothetical protein